MDTPYTYVHDRSNLRVGTYISINNSGMEIFLYDFVQILLKLCGHACIKPVPLNRVRSSPKQNISLYVY
jgi:hypothetical protein